jgi:SAM-dependent methyltransferase
MNQLVPEPFQPRWYSIFFNPFYIIRSRLCSARAERASFIQGRVLDFGCGSKPYKSYFTCKEYIGLDYATEISEKNKNLAADVFYDGKTIPFPDNHFDSVFSSEVLEHVFNPDDILPEINRVLIPGGVLLLTCPFFWPEHEQPYDYARYSSFGLKHLIEKNGFEVVDYKKTGSYFLSLLQGLVLYIYYFIPHKPRIIYLLFFLVFITPLLLLGLALNVILPTRIKRSDFYLNNVIVARKK